MKIFLISVSLIVITFVLFHFYTGYRSAFEADQQCHYELRLKANELDNLGCDHDLETSQWLLFQESINEQPSIVLKRFRY